MCIASDLQKWCSGLVLFRGQIYTVSSWHECCGSTGEIHCYTGYQEIGLKYPVHKCHTSVWKDTWVLMQEERPLSSETSLLVWDFVCWGYHRRAFAMQGGRPASDNRVSKLCDCSCSLASRVIFLSGKNSVCYFLLATDTSWSVFFNCCMFVDMTKWLEHLTWTMPRRQSCWRKFLLKRQWWQTHFRPTAQTKKKDKSMQKNHHHLKCCWGC